MLSFAPSSCPLRAFPSSAFCFVSTAIATSTFHRRVIVLTSSYLPSPSPSPSRPAVRHFSGMASKYAKDQPAGFENRISRVAFIGGSGQVGKHILNEFINKGQYTITAITRPGSTSSFPTGVEVKKADYSGDDDTQLVEALRGQQVLLVHMAVTAPRDTIPKIARAANKAGVSYVMPNWTGHDDANDSLCKDSFLTPARDSTKATFAEFKDTAYIFLVCNFWYEFSLAGGPDRFGFDFKKRSLIWFDDGDVKLNTTTWPQCGRALANVFSFKILPEDANDTAPTISQWGNKSIYISSFLVNQKDIFESVKRVTGTTDADWTFTRESSKKRWEDNHAEVLKGNFSAFTPMLYARMFFPTGDSDYQSRRGIDNEVLGLPQEDFDEWTKKAVGMGERGEVQTHH